MNNDKPINDQICKQATDAARVAHYAAAQSFLPPAMCQLSAAVAVGTVTANEIKASR